MVREPERKVILFPSDQKERKRILRESEDKRVRVCTLLRSICGWLLAIALFFALLLNYRLFMPSSLRELAGYATAGLNQQQGDMTTISYPSGSLTDGALFGSSLAFADSDTLYVSRPGSSVSLQHQLGYTDAAIDTTDDYILCYNRSGTKASLYNSVAQAASVEVSSPIITGALCAQGNFVIVTDENGYRTAATVFNASGQEVFKWSSSEYYIVSAALAGDGKTLAAIGFLQNGISLDTHVLFFSVGKDNIQADCTLSDELGMQLAFLSDGAVSVLTDSGITRVTTKGDATKLSSFTASDLLSFCYSGSKLVVATRSYSGVARSEYTVLNANGKLSDPVLCAEEPTALALSPSGVAVLTASGVSLYDMNGNLKWSNPEAVGARRILLSNDNTVYALYPRNARLFTASSEQSARPEA